jgi:hypothetical protein
MSTILCPFAVGQAIDFQYPDDNRYNVRTRLEPRRLAIQRIRDLEEQPLEDETLEKNPHLRRCRYLITGHDMIKHEWRSFYLDSMRKLAIVNAPLSRLALYDPVVPWVTPRFIGSVYTDSINDLAEAKLVIDDLHEELARAESSWAVGLFPWRRS